MARANARGLRRIKTSVAAQAVGPRSGPTIDRQINRYRDKSGFIGYGIPL